LLCYRCGSYTPDGSHDCSVCGQPFSERRTTGRTPALAVAGSPKHVVPFAPGTLVGGRYRVAEPIAQGTAGWVLRARDEEVDVDVALKVIAANLLQTEADRKRFVKVLQRVRRVQHANLARIYEDGQDEHYVFYAMPHLEGLTLRKIIDLRLEKAQVFAMEDALPLLLQLSHAIDILDEIGVHGALRPTNVIVLPDIIKLTGVAHLQGLPRRPFVAAQMSTQTAPFLAPEARREGGKLTGAADVYSVGVIAGEMLTGLVHGRDPEAWAEASQRLAPGVVRVIERALSDDPEARFDSGKALFSALVDAHQEAGDGAGGLAVEDESTAPGRPSRASPPPASLLSVSSVEHPLDGQTDPELAPGPELFVDEETVRTPGPPAGERARPKPQVMAPLDTPVPLTHKRRNTDPVAPPKSALGRRAGPRRRAGGVWVAMAIVAAGAAVSAAIFYQRHVRGSLDLNPVAQPSGSAPVFDDGGEAFGPGPGDDPRSGRGRRDRQRRPAPDRKERGRSEPRDQAGRDTPAPLRDEPATVRSAPAPTPKVIDVMPPPPVPPPAPVQPYDGDKRPIAKTPVVARDPTPPQPVAVVVERAPPPRPTPARPAKAGCPDGMVMIAAGSFEMGSQANDPQRGFGDLPARRKSTDAFCVDVFEFPNERGKRPAANTSWASARRSCENVGKRLCSEAEWERACKGPDNLRFPTGNSFNPALCNASGGRQPLPAGKYGNCRGDYGTLDMSGNVAEWTSSRWSADIADKVVKGGAADQADYTARCAARANESPGTKSATLGFRCCKDPG